MILKASPPHTLLVHELGAWRARSGPWKPASPSTPRPVRTHLRPASQMLGTISTRHWPQRSDLGSAGLSLPTGSQQHRRAFRLLTSLEISRCFSAKCMACSWLPRAVYAFPKLQHALPSPILRNDQSKLAVTRREVSVVMLPSSN